MTSNGHRIGGFGAAVVIFAATAPVAGQLPAAAAAVASLAGARAPDWLEVPMGPFRLVPHRTLTHWMLLWAVLSAAAFIQLQITEVGAWALAFGFSLGALVHLSGDLLTPMGVPVLHPIRRTSLRLGRSGGLAELVWLSIIWGAAAFAVWGPSAIREALS